jgi:hypothetical protein
MRKVILCGALLSIPVLSAAYAQGAARLTGWSYRSENRYLTAEYAATTGHDLIEGTSSTSP